MNFGTKIVGTIVVLLGWFAFIVLYLAFFAEAFDVWQKLALFIASGVIVIGALVVYWIMWVFRH